MMQLLASFHLDFKKGIMLDNNQAVTSLFKDGHKLECGKGNNLKCHMT
jgi:hypothetical protein